MVSVIRHGFAACRDGIFLVYQGSEFYFDARNCSRVCQEFIDG